MNEKSLSNYVCTVHHLTLNIDDAEINVKIAMVFTLFENYSSFLAKQFNSLYI